MSTKNNIRSFRFSDEVAGILEAYPGDSFNDKFEKLTLHCFWEGKKIDADIAAKKKQYADLCKKCDEKRQQLFDLDNLLTEEKRLTSSLAALGKQFAEFRERVTQKASPAPAADPEGCVTTPKKKKSVTQKPAQAAGAAVAECVTTF